jgi:hypothetical protein
MITPQILAYTKLKKRFLNKKQIPTSYILKNRKWILTMMKK